MTVFYLIVVLIVAGFVVWAIDLLPIDGTFKTLIKGIAILIAVLYTVIVVLRLIGFAVPIGGL